MNIPIWNLVTNAKVPRKKFGEKKSNICIRRLMGSTNQADPSCFYFRISWILMEWRWFYFFCPLHLVQGLKSLEHRLLQKLSMKNFDQKFRFFIKRLDEKNKINIIPSIFMKSWSRNNVNQLDRLHPKTSSKHTC